MTDIPRDQPAPAYAGHHAPAWFWPTIRFIFKNIGAAAIVLAFVAYFAVPRAQDFIKDTVADRLNNLENQMDTVQRSVQDQQREQAVMQNDLGHIKQDQDETRRNTRMILQSLQGIRNEMRQD